MVLSLFIAHESALLCRAHFAPLYCALLSINLDCYPCLQDLCLSLLWDLFVIIYMHLLFCQFVNRVEASRMHLGGKEYTNSAIFSESSHCSVCDKQRERKRAGGDIWSFQALCKDEGNGQT